MNKFIGISILTIVVSGCSSFGTKEQHVEVCENYSNAYLAVSMMQSNGLNKTQAKMCAVAGVTSLNQLEICEGTYSKSDVKAVNLAITSYEKDSNDLSTLAPAWMVSVVEKIYSSPIDEPHHWKFKMYEECMKK